MKRAELKETESTIRFSVRLFPGAVLMLPKNASTKLPSRVKTMVEGTINGFPFRAALEPNGEGGHGLKVNKALEEAAGAGDEDTVAVEITRVEDEPETRIPTDLREALAAATLARELWAEITPMARRDWILWIISAKQMETRASRVEKACSMLAAGKKRVCCFGGLNWLRKDHPKAGETWLPLPSDGTRTRGKK